MSEDNVWTRNRGCGDLILWPALFGIILVLLLLGGYC